MKKICAQINLGEKVLSWCEKTTFHAVPNIATNEHIILKIMWSICLIASLGYCCRILTSSINDYYEYRVLTTFEIVQESSNLFPVITICNLNEYDLSKNTNLLNMSNYLIENTDDKDLNPKETFEKIKKEFLKNANITELEETRFKLNDMLISCNFNEIKCDLTDFTLIKNELYGNCYSFNMAKNESIRSTSKYGPKYGLQMEFYIGHPESSSPTSLTSGAILFINNQSSLVRLTDPGIELSPGTQTNIAINRMFIYKLPQPYSDCIQGDLYENNETYFVQMTLSKRENYSQSFCLDICYENYLVNECNCTDKDLNNTCYLNTENFWCFYEMKKKFFDLNFNENCKQQCPIECERVTYKVASLSTADYPSLFYEKILLNNSFIRERFKIEENIENLYSDSDDTGRKFYEEFRNSILSVNVYYDTDTYEKITETPETNFETLLANLGGQFGLFLGISLLSFLELIELFVWVIVYLIQKISALISS
ncbi:unnamed protein product [Brachionus calyciflorus]|uniref:Uncharacterized protein n=1 Tax=Brachionus calyciflorus TaxID=104777 RepID=A0A813ZPF5_9BILA|nr:unnamed protein product [Brachionus calyciflorus]